CVVLLSSSAAPSLTLPKLVQLLPLVEYCQVPLPVVPVTAMPDRGLVSTSPWPAPLRMAETSVPEEVVSSSVPVSDTGVGVAGSVGASLTLLTASVALLLLMEKAVVPPPAPG